MPLPKQDEIEEPLLREIAKLGGGARPRDVYPRLRVYFPQITDADLAEKTKSGPNLWTNRIQWARNDLVKKGELYREPHGIWRITEKGRQRIGAGAPISSQPVVVAPSPQPAPAPVTVAVDPHTELVNKIKIMGRLLKKYVDKKEADAPYQHDALWYNAYYQRPAIAWEVCYHGNVDKDLASLQWAADPQNWGAKGVLVVFDGNDELKARKVLGERDDIAVVSADLLGQIYSLMNLTEGERLLRMLFPVGGG